MADLKKGSGLDDFYNEDITNWGCNKKSYVVEEVVVVVVVVVVVLQRSRFKKDDFKIFELKKLHSKS